MFKSPIPLSKSQHRALRLTARRGYAFASEQTVVPIVMSEAAVAAREYAIVFPGEGGGVPLVLTGLPPGPCAYVTASGDWLARYVPAHLRRYPFVLGQPSAQAAQARAQAASARAPEAEPDRRYVLQFDEGAAHLSTQEGAPLFDAQGEPTEVLKKVQGALLSLQTEYDRTQALVAQLEEVDLLTPVTLRVQPREGDSVALSGFRVVDARAFAALEAPALARLRDSGALMLVYAHLLSLHNLRDGVLSWGGKRREAATAGLLSPGLVGLPEDQSLDFSDIDWSKLADNGSKH